ncbi:MAG TPA: carboxypeptidase-like regulatory domain-containing protein [Mucilaginibacter sp.]|nr:carboxypeptidase-like regulatory domain-containing protein [Mucilaginibacter sp.]
MKKAILSWLLILTSTITFAQTVTVSGTVNDQQGKPVAFAFISESQHPYGTYSDANGAFTLKADPAANITVTASHYKTTTVKISDPAATKIALEGGESGTDANEVKANSTFFKQDESLVDMSFGSRSTFGQGQESLHGSRFLFDNWAHGFAITPKDSIKQNDVYLFNYDKITGDLIFTRNQKTVLQVIKSEIKAFTLFDPNAQPYVFEDVPSVDAKHYLQVLSSGKKYKIYKNLGTKFIKANFTTNGITSSGNNYDEYVDQSTYYFVKLPGGQPQKLALKKKALKLAFAEDADKLNKFLADNDGDIDDNYLKNLGDYINQ